MGTPMEKIKAYQQIESFISTELAEQVAAEMEFNDDDLGLRLDGKDSEYDFLFRCHSLGEIDKIIAFEESASRLTRTVTVDFLFVLKNGRRLAIEVKTTQQPNKSITSAKRLKEQREFAELMSAELYYAVFIEGDWELFSAVYVESKKQILGKESYKVSEMEILGERYFLISDPITLKSYYREQEKKPLYVNIPETEIKKWIIQDNDLGYAEKFIIEAYEQNILTINRPNAQKFMIIILALHALFSAAANNHREVIKQKHGRTLVIDTSENVVVLKLSDFLIEPVYNLWRSRKKKGIPRKFIAHLVDKDERELMTPAMVLMSLAYLYEKGIRINVLSYTNEIEISTEFIDAFPEHFESENAANV